MLNKDSVKAVKVCHVTSAHTRYDVRIFHKECRSLAEYGFDVTLVVNDDLPDESVNEVKIISTQMKPNNRYERMIKSKKRIKELMLEVDADIYHFHDPELLPEASWIKATGKKVIFDFHEDVSQQILFKTWIPAYIRKIVALLYRRYEKDKAQKFDALISVTPKFVERLKQINAHTIMVTNYPIVKENSLVIERNKNRTICFAGGISPQWNHENIIRAIESIDDIEYILAGNCSQEYMEKLKGLEGWNKVRYLGRIPHEEVKSIYNESRIGMTLLSNNTQVGDEGTLGNTKIFEFMEAGLPVICSSNRIWRDIINENENGIAINPDDINEIKDSINYLFDNEQESQKMGINGRNAVNGKYSWHTQEKVLIELYNTIIS